MHAKAQGACTRVLGVLLLIWKHRSRNGLENQLDLCCNVLFIQSLHMELYIVPLYECIAGVAGVKAKAVIKESREQVAKMIVASSEGNFWWIKHLFQTQFINQEQWRT